MDLWRRWGATETWFRSARGDELDRYRGPSAVVFRGAARERGPEFSMTPRTGKTSHADLGVVVDVAAMRPGHEDREDGSFELSTLTCGDASPSEHLASGTAGHFISGLVKQQKGA